MIRRKKQWLIGLLVALMAFFQTAYGAGIAKTETEQQFVTALSSLGKAGAEKVEAAAGSLTRERAAVLITKYLGYEALADELKNSCRFKDVAASKGEIELMARLELMNGINSSSFSPQTVMTSDQAAAVIGKIASRLKQPAGWKHACYAISSSSQMADIPKFDAVSFGWAQLEKTASGYEVMTEDAGSDFKVPAGFTAPLDLAAGSGVETYLMVYYEDKNNEAAAFLNNAAGRAQVISQLVSLSQGLTREGETRAFDGITIDFEGFYSSSLRAPYVTFLKELRQALAPIGKKLNTAVQPSLYYKGYDYKGIGENSDHVILMAHDYAAKTLTAQQLNAGFKATPLTPIDKVYAALSEAKSEIKDTSKIALQFSFASLQWQQTKAGKGINQKAYTPSYEQIASRLSKPGTAARYNSYYQCAYAVYSENDITNIIWYENEASLQSKMDLAKLLGISGYSYWRLGLFPEGGSLVK